MFNHTSIEATITTALRNKLHSYKPESSHMPFHTCLLGLDRMALFSFIRSLNATFGTAVFEQVAREIARGVFDTAELQVSIAERFQSAGQELVPAAEANRRKRQKVTAKPPVFRSGAQAAITGIINDLRAANSKPDHSAEISLITERMHTGDEVVTSLSKVDIFLTKGNHVYLIDLKTAKPNKTHWPKYKQELLEWSAAVLYRDSSADVRSIIAIPYNPYEPAPYDRWRMRGILDIQDGGQLLVAEEFWNFLAGGQDIYRDLLTCFENVRCQMRDEIDDYFKTLGY